MKTGLFLDEDTTSHYPTNLQNGIIGLCSSQSKVNANSLRTRIISKSDSHSYSSACSNYRANCKKKSFSQTCIGTRGTIIVNFNLIQQKVILLFFRFKQDQPQICPPPSLELSPSRSCLSLHNGRGCVCKAGDVPGSIRGGHVPAQVSKLP